MLLRDWREFLFFPQLRLWLDSRLLEFPEQLWKFFDSLLVEPPLTCWLGALVDYARQLRHKARTELGARKQMAFRLF